MFTFILTLFVLANIATCIYLYLYYGRLASDLCKSKDKLNQIRKELDDAVSMRNERYSDFKFVETEEDAKNYKIPDNLPTKQDVEKWLNAKNKINPCRKCGGEAILHIDETDRSNGYFIRWAFVRCQKCQETGTVVSDVVFNLATEKTTEDAIKKWNENN